MVAASFNPSSQNTNHYVLTTNDMSYQHWVWWSGDTSAASTYNLESLRPGVVGRYKLVENLHWNHIPDVNGDTFVIINNTNQSGLIGALTVPYIPYASDTNKLRDSHLYWTADGTGTSTNFYVAGFSNSVDYARLDIRHGGTNNSIHFDSQSTGVAGTPRPFKWDFGSSNYLTLSINGTENPSLTFSEPSTVVTTTLSQNFGSGVLYNASSLSVGAANDGFTIGSGTIVAGNANGGLIQHQGWGSGIDSTDFGIYHTGTNGVAVLNSHATAGSPGGVRDFIFATNGVEIARLTTNGNLTVSGTITATGGMTNAANWNPVGTTDSSLAGTATLSSSNSTRAVSMDFGSGYRYYLGYGNSTNSGVPNRLGGFYYNYAGDTNDVQQGFQFENRFENLPAGVDSEFILFWNAPNGQTGSGRSLQINTSWGPNYGASQYSGQRDVAWCANRFMIGSNTVFDTDFLLDFTQATPLASWTHDTYLAGKLGVGVSPGAGTAKAQIHGTETEIYIGDGYDRSIYGIEIVNANAAGARPSLVLRNTAAGGRDYWIASTSGEFEIWDGTAVNVPFAISSAGYTIANFRLGVATNAPSEKLEVAGSVKATGYKSWDGANTFTGITATNSWVDASAVTWTMVIQNGLVTSMTHVP